MKRALGCAIVVALLAGTASALSVGPGGYIYTSVGTKPGSYWTGASLFRTTVDGSWASTETGKNFDNLTMVAYPSTTWDGTALNKAEVWDPRVLHGNGDLAIVAAATVRSTSVSAEGYPWDIVRVDADCSANNKSFSTSAGNILMVGGANRYAPGTGKPTQFVRTATDWGLANHGVGVVYRGSDSGCCYHFDKNGNGYIDNSSISPAEYGTAVTAGDTDMEFGPDGHTYWSTGKSFGTAKVSRLTVSSTGALTNSTFFTSGGAGNVVAQAESEGTWLAVGGTVSRQITYITGQDCTSTTGIFALIDGDGDGVVTPGNAADCITEVWKSGGYGLTMSYGWVDDIEYYKDGNGAQWLVFTGGQATAATNGLCNLYVLQLADNGLISMGGKLIASNGAGTYFELDMNPAAAVPEPGSLVLLGTAALGVTGYIRRRKLS